MIFCRCAQHRWTADVDLLDRLGQTRSLPADRFLEGVEIHDDQIDRRDVVGLDVCAVLRYVPIEQDSAEDSRGQRLDPPAEDLGAACVFGDGDDVDSGLGEMGGRASRREDLDSSLGEKSSELDDASLVVYREKCSADRKFGAQRLPPFRLTTPGRRRSARRTSPPARCQMM